MGRTLGFVRGHGLRLQELVPGRARALLVGAGVPRRRADDEAVEGSNTGAIEVINHHSLKAGLGRQVPATIGCGPPVSVYLELHLSWRSDHGWADSVHSGGCNMRTPPPSQCCQCWC